MQRRPSVIVALGVVASAGALAAGVRALAWPLIKPVQPGQQILLTLASPTTRLDLPPDSRVAPIAPALGDVLVTVPPRDPHRLSILVARLRASPGVLAAQPDTPWHASQSGNQAECAPRPESPDTGAAAAVHATTSTPPASTPPIAILDTGVDATRPELAGRVLPGANIVSGGTNTSDRVGHGTAVAAVAAGAPGETRGVSPTSPILPIKILDNRGQSSAAWVVAGINAALARGARVINISATGPASNPLTPDDQVVMRAIDTAVSRGAVVIAPSGNEGAHSVDVPASYPHVLAVAATGSDGLPASFSNSGPAVDLAAPGEALTEPAPTSVCPSGYQLASGTSFAAPAAAGAAALLLAAQPSLTATQALEMLRRGPAAGGTATWNAQTGFGGLDVASVLGAHPPPATPREVNDDAFWVKHTAALVGGGRRSASVAGRIDATKNPLDVFPVRLRRGQRLTATVRVQGGRVALALWDPKTGAFDISTGRTRHRTASSAGGASASLRAGKARRRGTYLLAVQARGTPAGGSVYTLSAAAG